MVFRMSRHQVRIVGGQYRRTPIPVLELPGLRPTPDRVRETLFNWLNHFWDGRYEQRHMLDLFAGTGALGFEAASRGVGHILMVEQNAQAAAAMRTLRNKLGAHAIRIHHGDAGHILERAEGSRYDLVTLDPPFGADWMSRIWPCLPFLLAPDGLAYIETESPQTAPEGFELLRSGRAGQVHYHLFRIAAPQKSVDNRLSGPSEPPAHTETT